METRALEWRLALTAFFGAAGELLGWKGMMLVLWVVSMALDYISGSVAAAKNRRWSSTTARQGLWHKGGMILVVLVAGIADAVFVRLLPQLPLAMATVQNPGLLLPLVLAWYILTEAGSVLENAVKLGAKVPDWLGKVLKVGQAAVDKAGEGQTSAEKDESEEKDDG